MKVDCGTYETKALIVDNTETSKTDECTDRLYSDATPRPADCIRRLSHDASESPGKATDDLSIRHAY